MEAFHDYFSDEFSDVTQQDAAALVTVVSVSFRVTILTSLISCGKIFFSEVDKFVKITNELEDVR